MKTFALTRFVGATLLTAAFIVPAGADEVSDRAIALAGQQDFDQALLLLSEQDSGLKNSYDHRFAKARILSWDKQYGRAEAELSALIAEHPEDADLQLVMGNLKYYQSDLTAAQGYYQGVLDKFPNYTDASTGLENVRKARSAQAKAGKYRFRFDTAASISDFNQNAIDGWNSQSLRSEYKTDILAYHGALARYKRFGKTDIELGAGIADAVRGGWDWGLQAGFTPDADFRPKLSAGGRLGKTFETGQGPVLYPEISYRFDDYDTGAIHTIQPGVVSYFDNGFVLTGRLIATLADNRDDQIGVLASGLMPVTDRLNLNLGLANAPEAIDGVAITTKSVFGGATYSLSDGLDVFVNLSRDDRENSYVRNSVNVGITHKR